MKNQFDELDAKAEVVLKRANARVKLVEAMGVSNDDVIEDLAFLLMFVEDEHVDVLCNKYKVNATKAKTTKTKRKVRKKTVGKKSAVKNKKK